MPRLLANRGLITSSSELTRPEGALTIADNCIIDFDNTIQQRRGFKEYSQLLAQSPKQILAYKNKILTHYDTKLAYDSNDTGTFVDFAGDYSELISGLRIKGLETSGNFYFTTTEGIKKISAETAEDIASSSIVNAGAVKAIDLTGSLVPDSAGFLPAQSKVAYRLMFGYKDASSNLLRGTPSARLVLTNQSQDVERSEIFTYNVIDYSTLVDGDYLLFSTADTGYFIWFKKTGTGTAPINADTLDREGIEVDIQSATSDTEVAAYMANSISSSVQGITVELSGTEIEITITTPGDVSDVGQGNILNTEILATKVFDGSITTGSPAKAELTFTLPPDINTNYFYQIYRTAYVTVTAGVTLADIDPGDENYFVYESPVTADDITAGVITIEENTPDSFRAVGAPLYTNAITGEGITQSNNRPPIAQDIALFRNSTFYANTKDVHRLTFTMLSVDDFVSGSTKFYINQSGTTAEYTFVGTRQVVDVDVATFSFTTEGEYFTLNSSNNEREYYLWMDKGTGIDPAVAGKLGVRVPLFLYEDAPAGSKQALLDALLEIPDFEGVDFDTNTIRITNVDSGFADAPTDSGTGWTQTVQTIGEGEDASANEVFLSQNTSVGLAIDLTARSLVNVINKDNDSPVTAQYLSGSDDLPGQIILEAKSLQDSKFYIATSDAALSVEFNPELPSWDEIVDFPTSNSSDNNTTPNRIYFSKISQPEAVPLTNYIDIGSKDKPILRILALRDNLFVLKTDGIYIVTGASAPNFSVRLLDNSAILTAPDTAVVLNNLIYCLTTQGIVSISDSGVSIVSRQIEDQIKKVTTFAYTFKYTSFGVAYESDRSYIVWLPTSKLDTKATQAFRYNTITNTWTRWVLTNTCGIVNAGDDRMYLGKGDREYVAQERKNEERQDYADRDFAGSIADSSVDDTQVTLNSVTDVEVGDRFVQEQYVTIIKFNRMLKKLDADNGTTDKDYHETLAVSQGANMANAILALAAKLNADPTLSGLFTTPSGLNDLISLRDDYNTIIAELNGPGSGTVFKDYVQLNDLLLFEVLILEMGDITNSVITDRASNLIVGDVRIYKAIKTKVQWSTQHFGSPEKLKQIREGTIIFDNSAIYNGIISYSTDRSSNFESVEFQTQGTVTLAFEDIPFTNEDGSGYWDSTGYGEGVFGGSSNDVNIRTLIPQDKSRCRYINVMFQHFNAREQYKLIGISLEPREISTRAYR